MLCFWIQSSEQDLHTEDAYQDDSEEGDTVIAVNSRVLPDAHKMKSSDPTCSGNRQPAAYPT
jgi:hypothetical protein